MLAPPPPESARRAWMRAAVILFPIALTFVYAALLASKTTRPFAVLMTQENYPVELLTFAFCMLAGAQSLRLARQLRLNRTPLTWRTFYILFGALLIWVALEEIDYGQWFVHFRTPEAIARINTQHEFNLHNLQGVGGHTEYMRLIFGVGGLVGIALSYVKTFRVIAVPPVLLSWFCVITLLAAIDLFCDLTSLDNTNLGKAMDVMSEVVELMIAMAASLYLYLNARRVVPLTRA